MEETKKVTVIIPVRAGSERVKNKNLRLIGGESLLSRKIRSLKECKNVAEIIVNSDSEEMLKIAKNLGVKTIRRDPDLAASSTLINDTIEDVFKNASGEHVMWAQVTSPLVSSEIVDKSIETYFEKLEEGYDSLATCITLKEFLWDENGPINYDKNKMPRSQDLKPIKKITFSMMIIPKEAGIKKKYYMGEKPYFFELDNISGIDIDHESDLFMANCFLVRESLLDIFNIKGENGS